MENGNNFLDHLQFVIEWKPERELKYEDFENQQKEIEKETKKHPFISSILDISDLELEYQKGAPAMKQKIKVPNLPQH